MRDPGTELPIFELEIVLLPGELLPLHIFEERYKRMIERCVETSAPFGIVYRDADGARRIGCEARVVEIVERFDDGRINIIVSGERPFRVLGRREAPEYPTGAVEPIDVAGEGTAGEEADLAREAFASLVERISGEPPDAHELEAEGSYGIAARVELPAETKQLLLELRSEPERMTILGEALRALVGLLERSHGVAERAKLNGKVVVG